MTALVRADFARRLEQARKTATPLTLTENCNPDLFGNPEDSGRVAEELARLAEQQGRKRSGWKIGLTSTAALKAFGAKEPMVGRLYADAALPPGASLELSLAIAPRIEGEIMLEIAHPCSPEADETSLLASIASVSLAIEIADSRIDGWPGTVALAAADNACCGWYMRSETACKAEIGLLARAHLTMLCNGEEVITGNASDNLAGDNLRGILGIYRWFLQDSAETGRALTQGDLLLTGALGPAIPMQQHSTYQVSVNGLGALALRTL
ncbi:MAG: 2-keto-4-pentenoate hydratase [Sphingomonadaceae bacterium]